MTVYGEDFRLAVSELLENRATERTTPAPYRRWSNFWLRKIKSLLDALAYDGVEVYADLNPVTYNTIFREVSYKTPVVTTSYAYGSMLPVQLGYRREIAIAQAGVDLEAFNYPDEQVFNILVMLTKNIYYEENIPKYIREAMRRGDLEW